MKITCLAGIAGHGKSTAAEVFVEHGWLRAPLAEQLKNMVELLLSARGAPFPKAYTCVDKEKPNPYLNGATTRRALQTLGTEWGRELSDTLWLDTWRDFHRLNSTAAPGLVVDDVRFENEAKFLRDLGAEIFVVRRPGFTKNVEAHSSEDLAWAAGEEVIWNDGYPTAGDFQDSVRARFFS